MIATFSSSDANDYLDDEYRNGLPELCPVCGMHPDFVFDAYHDTVALSHCGVHMGISRYYAMESVINNTMYIPTALVKAWNVAVSLYGLNLFQVRDLLGT